MKKTMNKFGIILSMVKLVVDFFSRSLPSCSFPDQLATDCRTSKTRVVPLPCLPSNEMCYQDNVKILDWSPRGLRGFEMRIGRTPAQFGQRRQNYSASAFSFLYRMWKKKSKLAIRHDDFYVGSGELHYRKRSLTSSHDFRHRRLSTDMYRGGQRRDRWSNAGGDSKAASKDAEPPFPDTTCSHASTERASYRATGATSAKIDQTAKA